MSTLLQAQHFSSLKERHRAIRDGLPEGVALRTHRALSWLGRAELEAEDDDARFLFLWIAFNAAYANELSDRTKFSDRRLLIEFLDVLLGCDTQHRLYDLVWTTFPSSIRSLIDNPYVFQPFWDRHSGRTPDVDWQAAMERHKQTAYRALGVRDTRRVLAIVFDRLYVLRNQLVHGGATWNSSVNRSQIRDGANIMAVVVPAVIDLMMSSPDRWRGAPVYPWVR